MYHYLIQFLHNFYLFDNYNQFCQKENNYKYNLKNFDKEYLLLIKFYLYEKKFKKIIDNKKYTNINNWYYDKNQ